MKNHSWASNALACSQKRFQRLLYLTPSAIMLDRGETGTEFWERIEREKQTARQLNEIAFSYDLYYSYEFD
jgi:hypothetical protein